MANENEVQEYFTVVDANGLYYPASCKTFPEAVAHAKAMINHFRLQTPLLIKCHQPKGMLPGKHFIADKVYPGGIDNDVRFEIVTSFDDNAAVGNKGDVCTVAKWNGCQSQIIQMIVATMNADPEVAYMLVTAADMFVHNQGPKPVTIGIPII